MHIEQFPKDVQDFIHELCAKAILRAINNGTYVPTQNQNEESQEGDS